MPFEEEFLEPTSEKTATTCPYCGVGCGVIATPSSDGQTAEVKGDENHPANFGKLCSKGSALGETLTHEERLLDPFIKGIKSDWNSALDLVAGRFLQTIAEHGPDSVAFYVSGQLLTEDYYVANKLMKGFIGSSNIDTNSRLCMASSVAGHKRAFGSDTVPGCYEDLELSDLVILVGANFAWCHPVLHQRLLAAKADRGTRIVVIDPRETATTDAADLHLKIKNGGDVALFNALFAYLANSQAYDDEFVKNHTQGLGDALEEASRLSMQEVVEQTGLSIDVIQTFFEWVVDTPNTMTVYSQGVNQSSAGTDKVNSIINCHLVTGRIGRAGMGPFSITGQPNAMGGREVGGLSNQLAVHMDYDTESIDRVQRFWNAPNIAQSAGLKAVDMFEAVAEGKIKALWIMATNPAVSMPNAGKVKEAIEACPFVVVSDIVNTSDTVKLADVQLPATAWGEKSGTVTNSERRISRQRSFLKPPGNSRHDWDIISDVARRMGFEGFDYKTSSDIFFEYAQMSTFENNGSRDFDIGKLADITSAEYDAMAPFQWPARKSEIKASSPKRFFADGQFFTPNKRARFISTPVRPSASSISEDFDLILNTGRIRDHWHTMTRTGKTQRLSTHIGEPFVEINPVDAQSIGLVDADISVVKSQWGSAHLRVVVTDRVSIGSVFAPMHWTRRFSSKGCVDEITSSNFDPISGQPEMKYTPVSIRKMQLDWWAFGVFEEEPDAKILEKYSYWAVTRRGLGWSVEVAGTLEEAENQDFVDELCKPYVLGESITFVDTNTGDMRQSFVQNENLKAFVTVSRRGPVKADRVWLGQYIGNCLDSSARLNLLAGRPQAGEATGKIICSCMGVGAGTIEKAISAGAQTVGDVGKVTCAGTNCGSCKPEIAALISEYFYERDNKLMEFAEQ